MKNVSTTYPLQVNARRCILEDEECSMVFFNMRLGEWETPLTSKMEEGKKYRMVITLIPAEEG